MSIVKLNKNSILKHIKKSIKPVGNTPCVVNCGPDSIWANCCNCCCYNCCPDLSVVIKCINQYDCGDGDYTQTGTITNGLYIITALSITNYPDDPNCLVGLTIYYSVGGIGYTTTVVSVDSSSQITIADKITATTTADVYIIFSGFSHPTNITTLNAQYRYNRDPLTGTNDNTMSANCDSVVEPCGLDVSFCQNGIYLSSTDSLYYYFLIDGVYTDRTLSPVAPYPAAISLVRGLNGWTLTDCSTLAVWTANPDPYCFTCPPQLGTSYEITFTPIPTTISMDFTMTAVGDFEGLALTVPLYINTNTCEPTKDWTSRPPATLSSWATFSSISSSTTFTSDNISLLRTGEYITNFSSYITNIAGTTITISPAYTPTSLTEVAIFTQVGTFNGTTTVTLQDTSWLFVGERFSYVVSMVTYNYFITSIISLTQITIKDATNDGLSIPGTLLSTVTSIITFISTQDDDDGCGCRYPNMLASGHDTCHPLSFPLASYDGTVTITTEETIPTSVKVGMWVEFDYGVGPVMAVIDTVNYSTNTITISCDFAPGGGPISVDLFILNIPEVLNSPQRFYNWNSCNLTDGTDDIYNEITISLAYEGPGPVLIYTNDMHTVTTLINMMNPHYLLKIRYYNSLTQYVDAFFIGNPSDQYGSLPISWTNQIRIPIPSDPDESLVPSATTTLTVSASDSPTLERVINPCKCSDCDGNSDPPCNCCFSTAECGITPAQFSFYATVSHNTIWTDLTPQTPTCSPNNITSGVISGLDHAFILSLTIGMVVTYSSITTYIISIDTTSNTVTVAFSNTGCYSFVFTLPDISYWNQTNTTPITITQLSSDNTQSMSPGWPCWFYGANGSTQTMTGTITNGLSVITSLSITTTGHLYEGMLVYYTIDGITYNTYIISVDSTSQITIADTIIAATTSLVTINFYGLYYYVNFICNDGVPTWYVEGCSNTPGDPCANDGMGDQSDFADGGCSSPNFKMGTPIAGSCIGASNSDATATAIDINGYSWPVTVFANIYDLVCGTDGDGYSCCCKEPIPHQVSPCDNSYALECVPGSEGENGICSSPIDYSLVKSKSITPRKITPRKPCSSCGRKLDLRRRL